MLMYIFASLFYREASTKNREESTTSKVQNMDQQKDSKLLKRWKALSIPQKAAVFSAWNRKTGECRDSLTNCFKYPDKYSGTTKFGEALKQLDRIEEEIARERSVLNG
jgi:FtsZ-interacting cell division protein YlmF